ncbi:protein kinase [candidate division KSB3 bacterium]|uniref:Protein kinase n=1 Tax=candidate division KSB3 bacterium TaxID=2044937 RepID=A0A9D5JTB5_9BACT|nr:protein kinase [candidate division KSB3 bacterium]MBD3323874.1 protein kinase [candidate division KSB3 bacterium]
MHVAITVTDGPAKGQQFTFDEPDRFLFGRTADAHISLPNDPYVSRQHFLLEISPPECKITDLQSKNGVFVNGIRYGGRKPPGFGIKQAPKHAKETLLNDGDEIIVGETHLRIQIQLDESRWNETVSYAPKRQKKRTVQCVRCGKDVTDEAGARGQVEGSEYICKTCRKKVASKPLDLLNKLLNEAVAKKDSSDAPVIEGYQIEEAIERGGMGMVYKAKKTGTETLVAIKTMLPSVATNPDNIRAFQREIDVNRQLKHPNIVQFLDHGRSQGLFYFVLEFIDGMNLGAFLENNGGSLPVAEAAPLMLGILDGLTYAHRAAIATRVSGKKSTTFTGIVHRDLKPQNVLLARRNHHWIPKLSDFGISKSFESAGLTNITAPGEVLGTPMYWPREQITHYKYLNPATDVFSIAAVFYEMLTGTWIRKGFQELLDDCALKGYTPVVSEYMSVIMNNPIIPIHEVNPDIPKPLASVIERALRETEIPHDKTQMRNILAKLRYPDAGAFREALIQAFEAAGISTTYPESEPITPEVPAKSSQPQPVSDATIMQTSITPTSSRQVALLVLDLEKSSEYIREVGDTHFSVLIGDIYKRVKSHPSASDLIFLKTTGDGFLAVFSKISAAFSLALSFLKTRVHHDAHIRLALHWGTVKIGPEGDVLGAEVHRAFRIENVQREDQIEPPEYVLPLPPSQRILATAPALQHLSPDAQTKFRPAGKFRLKGFDDTCELWVLQT